MGNETLTQETLDLFGETEVEENTTVDNGGVTVGEVQTKVKEENVQAVPNQAQMAQTGLSKLNTIGKELLGVLYEREDEVKSIILGLLSKKNVLLLGPPGTAKSLLASEFSKHVVNANYFQWLLNRTSDPSELLGPISVKAMEKDQFIRKPAGKLPEAHIAFIDEIFKSNSATLNILLPIMNERIWYNDGVPLKANLQLAIGASNEFPEDEELGAFYDRFLFRHWTAYVGDSKNQFNMLKDSAARRTAVGTGHTRTLVTLDEIQAAQEFVDNVQVTDGSINALQKLLFELKKKDIHVSDRRAVACLHIMQAHAAYEGRSVTSPDDMEPLAYVLWERKEDIEDIKAEITKMMNPFKDKVNKAYKEAAEIQDKVMNIADKTDRANQAIDARNVLEKLAKRIDTVIKEAKKEGRDTTEFERKRDEITAMNNEIVNKCLLFSIDDDSSDENFDELPF